MVLNKTGAITPPVKEMHRLWDALLEGSPDRRILALCHSQGALLTRVALLSYDVGKRKRISVVAVAPAGYIYKDTCRSVAHYRAEFYRDFVPYMSFTNPGEGHTIKTLKSDSNAKFHDHDFNSPTHRQFLKRRINKFLEE